MITVEAEIFPDAIRRAREARRSSSDDLVIIALARVTVPLFHMSIRVFENMVILLSGSGLITRARAAFLGAWNSLSPVHRATGGVVVMAEG